MYNRRATLPTGTPAVPIEDKSNYDDVLSNTGVDLKEETDNILRENEIIGLRQPSSIPLPDRSKKQDFVDQNKLKALIQSIAIKQHKAMMNLHPDCLTYLALATQERITNLVEAMIAAKNNRIESENVKIPTSSPEGQENNNNNNNSLSPIFKQVLISDAKSQLLALEKIEREEERKRRELLFGPEITESNEKGEDINGPAEPPPPKRKRQKKDSNANAALQRLTNEAIATKITNQTALVAAGGLTKSWMFAATEETPIIPSLPVTINGKTNANINTDTTTASSSKQPRSRSLSVSAGKTTKRDIGTAFGGKSSSSQYNTSLNRQKFANGSSTSSKQQSEQNDSSNSLVTMKDALFVLERDRGGGGANSLVKGYIKWLR